MSNIEVSSKGLITLKGQNIPVKVLNEFWCNNNLLTSLEFGPKEVGQGYYCFSNRLTSLEFAPVKVGDSLSCYSNELTSLEFCPTIIGNCLFADNNYIANLKDIHKQFKNGYISRTLNLLENPLKSHLLGIILIPRLQHVSIDNKEAEVILEKHLKERDVLDCQEELIQNGFKEFAQL